MSGDMDSTGNMLGFRRPRLPANTNTTIGYFTTVPTIPRWQRFSIQSRTTQSTNTGEISDLVDSNNTKRNPESSVQAALGRCREESTPLNEAIPANRQSAFLVTSRNGAGDAPEAQPLEIEIDLGDLEDSLAGTPTAGAADPAGTGRGCPAAGPSKQGGQKRLWSLPFVDPRQAASSKRQAPAEEGNIPRGAAAEPPRWPSAATEVQAGSRWSAGGFAAQPAWPGLRAAPSSGEQTARLPEPNLPDGAANEALEIGKPVLPCGRHDFPEHLLGHSKEAEEQSQRAVAAPSDPSECGQSPAVLSDPLLSDGMHTSGSRKRGKALARRPKQPLKRIYMEHDEECEEMTTATGGESLSAQKRARSFGGSAFVGEASCGQMSQHKRLPSILSGVRRCINSEEQLVEYAMDHDVEDAMLHEEQGAHRPMNPFQSRQSREKNEQFKQEVARRRTQAQPEQVPAEAIRSVLQAFPQRPPPGDDDDTPIDLTSEDEAPGARACESGAPNACLGSEDELDWNDQPLQRCAEWQTSAARTSGAGPSSETRTAVGVGTPWWQALPDFVPLAALQDGINPRTGAVVHVDYKQQFVEAQEVPAAKHGGTKRGAKPWGGAKKPGGRKRVATGAGGKRKATNWGRAKFPRR